MEKKENTSLCVVVALFQGKVTEETQLPLRRKSELKAPDTSYQSLSHASGMLSYDFYCYLHKPI